MSEILHKLLGHRKLTLVKTYEEYEYCEIWASDTGHQVLVFPQVSDSVQIKMIDQLLHIAQIFHISHLIKLYSTSVSSSVQNKLAECKLRVELICAKLLICDITQHVLQPTFTLCDEVQRVNALAKHKYAPPQYPLDDPIVIWYGWKKGDVIAICDNKCQHLDQYANCCGKTRYRIVV